VELRQLRYFVKMVELGNMTRAAKQLYVAQPALSQQLTNLETNVGTRLLDRSVHGVSPTHAGKLFYKHAKAILRQVEDTTLALRAEIESPSGEVSLAMPASSARLIALPLLRKMLTEFPAIRLKLMELPSADIPGLLARGDVDVAIAVHMLPTKSIGVQSLLVEDLFAIFPASSPGLPEALTLSELARFPLILPNQSNSVRVLLDTALAKKRLAYHLVAEINVTSLLAMAALDGLGVTILPWSAVAEAVLSGKLRAIPLTKPALKREISICQVEDVVPSTATRLVRQAVRDVCTQLVAEGAWRGVRLSHTRPQQLGSLPPRL
jgi:LysR family nitrogen assimilation transcriptional regulator